MGDKPPEWLTAQIPGAADLIAWFGYWPSFHDAEVISIQLLRSGPSRLCLHTFDCTREVNKKGQYVCQKHVVITFLLAGLRRLELAGFNHQNVISGLTIVRAGGGYELIIEGCYGVEGALAAESVSIELAPGAPLDSQYLTEGLPGTGLKRGTNDSPIIQVD
jgi:hypothetical protein